MKRHLKLMILWILCEFFNLPDHGGTVMSYSIEFEPPWWTEYGVVSCSGTFSMWIVEKMSDPSSAVKAWNPTSKSTVCQFPVSPTFNVQVVFPSPRDDSRIRDCIALYWLYWLIGNKLCFQWKNIQYQLVSQSFMAIWINSNEVMLSLIWNENYVMIRNGQR